MDLKESLSFYRKEQGLSQVELAEALDVSRQTISKWETGAALPSAENLLALSRLYGVTVDALLNGVETEAPAAEPVPAPQPGPYPPEEADCADAGGNPPGRPGAVLYGYLLVRNLLSLGFPYLYGGAARLCSLRHRPVLRLV